MISRSIHPQQTRTALFALVAITGLSFWFFIGFPFANRNESFLWIAQFDQIKFFDTLRSGSEIGHVKSYRPLAIATAWLGYKLSGGSIVPQQILNYLEAALAWLILFSKIKEKRLFSLVACIVGGAFFSGYIYLFHLQGVSYSPLLIFLAVMLGKSISDSRITDSWLLFASLAAAVTSMYHPFALLIFGAFVIGHLLENLHTVTFKQMMIYGLLIAMSFVLINVIVPSRHLVSPATMLLGASTTYKLVELNQVVSIAAWLLSILSVTGLKTTWRSKAVVGGTITALSLAFAWQNWPVLIILIGVSLLKSALMRKWTIFFLTATTTVLPGITATGSASYSVWVLMTCACIVPLGCSFLERDTVVQDRLALLLLIFATLVVFSLKAGLHIPIISRIANPLLAEKEKTFQMESIISWVTTSDYNNYRLMLCQNQEGGSDGPRALLRYFTNVVDQARRPPTLQAYLDTYVDSLRARQPHDKFGQLMVCFGDEEVEGAKEIFSIAGLYNGKATVWSKNR